jgi:hypothetical protein
MTGTVGTWQSTWPGSYVGAVPEVEGIAFAHSHMRRRMSGYLLMPVKSASSQAAKSKGATRGISPNDE